MIIPFPDKTYDIIYADPPWPMKKIQRKSRPNQVEMDYPTMKLEEIEKLPVGDLAKSSSTLWLWTTHRFLPNALQIMASWGFNYQRLITWHKSNGMCLFGFHHSTELLLFGYKGTLEAFPTRKAVPLLVQEKSSRHSEKPAIFRSLIEPFGQDRIELFARKHAPGWDAWGNEVSPSLQDHSSCAIKGQSLTTN
jgi:N6-adenosine-specific RNA methylase IME4